jgi:hypothetical protein
VIVSAGEDMTVQLQECGPQIHPKLFRVRRQIERFLKFDHGLLGMPELADDPTQPCIRRALHGIVFGKFLKNVQGVVEPSGLGQGLPQKQPSRQVSGNGGHDFLEGGKGILRAIFIEQMAGILDRLVVSEPILDVRERLLGEIVPITAVGGDGDSGVRGTFRETRAEELVTWPIGGVRVKQMDPAEERLRRMGFQPVQRRNDDDLAPPSSLHLAVGDLGSGGHHISENRSPDGSLFVNGEDFRESHALFRQALVRLCGIVMGIAVIVTPPWIAK